jgi:hypothetical protein
MGAAVLWTATFTLGIVGRVELDLPLMFWALIVAMAAALMTGLAVQDYTTNRACRGERVSIEMLAQLMRGDGGPCLCG